MAYKAAIFDMDGTILNTLDDLTDALDYSLSLSFTFSWNCEVYVNVC